MEKEFLEKTAKTFFSLWLLDIHVEDNRCSSMPTTSTGKVVGIREDAVLLRVNNNVTNWYPFSNTNINFYI